MMTNRQCLIICGALLSFLFLCKVAIGQEMQQMSACTEWDPVTQKPVVNEMCRLSLLQNQVKAAEHDQRMQNIRAEKPKTVPCKIVTQKHIGSTSLGTSFGATYWQIEDAECVAPGEDVAIDDPFWKMMAKRVQPLEIDPNFKVPQTTFALGSSAAGPCILEQDSLGPCADKLCQPVEEHLRKYRTCER